MTTSTWGVQQTLFDPVTGAINAPSQRNAPPDTFPPLGGGLSGSGPVTVVGQQPVPFAAPFTIQPNIPPQQMAPPQQMVPTQQIAPPAVATQPQPQPQPQPQQAPPPAGNTAVPTAGPKTIQQLLREFALRPNCARYSGDAEKVKLLETFLWLRQLVPSLPFETFLDLFSAVADFDEKNLKHPEDAVKAYLPRTKKQATDKGVQQWSSEEVVDYVSLYIDMIREAERTNVPVPGTFNMFLANQELVTQFRAGAFAEKKQPATKKEAKPKAAAAQQRPSAAGQRVVFTNPENRQFRGSLLDYVLGADGVFHGTFRSDEGEVFRVTADQLTVTEDPAPTAPQTATGEPLPTLGHGTLWIGVQQQRTNEQTLALTIPYGTVEIGKEIWLYSYTYPNTTVKAHVNIVNGANGPYVDAFLTVNDQDVGDLDRDAREVRPRKNILGDYDFVTSQGVYKLTVNTR